MVLGCPVFPILVVSYIREFTVSRAKNAYASAIPSFLWLADRLLSLRRPRIRRALVAHFHVKGRGLEIGAMATPTNLPVGSRVRYVDVQPPASYRKQAEYAPYRLVEPVVIDDAERLSKFEDASQDFIVACHVLEHLENPIGALGSFFRVLKPGGKLILAIPDKRYTRDAGRMLTSFEHVLRDFEEGPEWSREEHYRETGRVIEQLDGEALEEHVSTSLRTRRNTHFHVWDFDNFAELLLRARSVIGVDYDIQEVISAGQNELISVMQRPRGKATSLNTSATGPQLPAPRRTVPPDSPCKRPD